MKKNFVLVAVFVAMAAAANATGLEQDKMAVKTTTEVTNKQTNAAEQTDIYRDHVLNSEENDKHIIRFYGIDRIVIENKNHAVIRIYDNNWKLVEQTTQDVDKQVDAGDYFITSSSRIKGRYLE